MARRRYAGFALLLAVAMLAAGCLGQATKLGQEALTEATAAHDLPHGSQATTSASEDRQLPASVVLTVAVRLDKTSQRALPVEDLVLASSLEDLDVDVRPLTVPSGASRAVATLHLPAGQRLPAIDATLRVDDGLGLATIPIEIGPWGAQRDARVSIALSTAEPGTVTVQSIRGDVPAKAHAPTSDPTYGLLSWPNGIQRVLLGFEGTIHVPPAYPDLPQGERMVFRLSDAQDQPVSWRLDGQLLETGPRLELIPRAGHHVLTVEVGEMGPSHSLSFSVDDRRTFAGTVEAGTGPLRRDVEGFNGDQHTLEVHAAANHLSAALELREPDGEATDLDLYLLDPDGNVVAQSAREGTSTERLRLPASELFASDYRLWVYAAEGADIEYELVSHVFYR